MGSVIVTTTHNLITTDSETGLFQYVTQNMEGRVWITTTTPVYLDTPTQGMGVASRKCAAFLPSSNWPRPFTPVSLD